jgi:hypothetical protein
MRLLLASAACAFTLGSGTTSTTKTVAPTSTSNSTVSPTSPPAQSSNPAPISSQTSCTGPGSSNASMPTADWISSSPLLYQNVAGSCGTAITPGAPWSLTVPTLLYPGDEAVVILWWDGPFNISTPALPGFTATAPSWNQIAYVGRITQTTSSLTVMSTDNSPVSFAEAVVLRLTGGSGAIQPLLWNGTGIQGEWANAPTVDIQQAPGVLLGTCWSDRYLILTNGPGFQLIASETNDQGSHLVIELIPISAPGPVTVDFEVLAGAQPAQEPTFATNALELQ